MFLLVCDIHGDWLVRNKFLSLFLMILAIFSVRLLISYGDLILAHIHLYSTNLSCSFFYKVD